MPQIQKKWGISKGDIGMADDLRVIKTRAAIRTAFRELVMEKNQFTVKDLTERANINRKTFYFHYTDMNDLRQQERHEAAEHIFTLLREPLQARDIPECMRRAFLYLASDPAYHYRLLSQEAYRRFFSEVFEEMGGEFDFATLVPAAKHRKYALAFLTNAIIFSFCEWYAGGMTAPAQEMADYVIDICLHGLKYL